MDAKKLQRLVGKNLRQARWAAGLTQEDLASRQFKGRPVISYRYYQELERGMRNPTLGTLAMLADVLDVTVAALVDVDQQATVLAKARLASAPGNPPRRGRRPSLRRMS